MTGSAIESGEEVLAYPSLLPASEGATIADKGGGPPNAQPYVLPMLNPEAPKLEHDGRAVFLVQPSQSNESLCSLMIVANML